MRVITRQSLGGGRGRGRGRTSPPTRHAGLRRHVVRAEHGVRDEADQHPVRLGLQRRVAHGVPALRLGDLGRHPRDLQHTLKGQPPAARDLAERPARPAGRRRGSMLRTLAARPGR